MSIYMVHVIFALLFIPMHSLPSYSENVLCKFHTLIKYMWCTSYLHAVISMSPNDAYMRQSIRPSLVQIRACRLSGAKPLSKPMEVYGQLDLRNKLQWNFHDQNTRNFIEWNLFVKIVCKMAAVLFTSQCVNLLQLLVFVCYNLT